MSLGMRVVLIEVLTVFVMIDLISTSKVIAASSDSEEENSLTQALYLVKLLKADYLRSLREEEELDTNQAYDDSNSTCPQDENNSTTPIKPGVAAATPPVLLAVTRNPLQPGAASSFTGRNLINPSVPEQISNIPPMNIETGVAQSANNAYPYRPNRRAGNEDIATPNFPMHQGNYRRFNYMPQPIYHHGEETLYDKGGYRRGNMPNSGKYDHGRSLNSPYTDPMHKKGGVFMPEPNFQPEYRRAGDGDPLTTGIVPFATKAHEADKGHEVKPVHNKNIARQGEAEDENSSAVTTATEASLNTPSETASAVNTEEAKSSKETTAKAKSSTEETTGAVNTEEVMSTKVIPEDTTKIASTNDKETSDAVDTENINDENTADGNTEDVSQEEKSPSDHVASVVASELAKEVKETTLPQEPPITFKTTMKVFLQRSSRLRIPFSENNAFCHLYPNNKLCSAGI